MRRARHCQDSAKRLQHKTQIQRLGSPVITFCRMVSARFCGRDTLSAHRRETSVRSPARGFSRDRCTARRSPSRFGTSQSNESGTAFICLPVFSSLAFSQNTLRLDGRKRKRRTSTSTPGMPGAAQRRRTATGGHFGAASCTRRRPARGRAQGERMGRVDLGEQDPLPVHAIPNPAHTDGARIRVLALIFLHRSSARCPRSRWGLSSRPQGRASPCLFCARR